MRPFKRQLVAIILKRIIQTQIVLLNGGCEQDPIRNLTVGSCSPFFKICSMRVVKEISHPECKITIFNWNNKYLIKLEVGPFEQTFKINETDLTGEEDLYKILNKDFISDAVARFADMSRSIADATDQI